MKKNFLKILGVVGIVATGICAYKVFKELNDLDLSKNPKDNEDDIFVDEKDINARNYFVLNRPIKTIKDKFSKIKNGENLEDVVDDIIDDIEDKIEEVISEEETYYDEFFETNIFVSYKEFIKDILDENKENLLFTKNCNVFYNGDFDVSELKKVFSEEYNRMKTLLGSEISGFGVLPMEMKPLENYLDEIDELSDLEDIKERVKGLLFYWISIGTSMAKY